MAAGCERGDERASESLRLIDRIVDERVRAAGDVDDRVRVESLQRRPPRDEIRDVSSRDTVPPVRIIEEAPLQELRSARNRESVARGDAPHLGYFVVRQHANSVPPSVSER